MQLNLDPAESIAKSEAEPKLENLYQGRKERDAAMAGGS
jgi:hypothetical protein